MKVWKSCFCVQQCPCETEWSPRLEGYMQTRLLALQYGVHICRFSYDKFVQKLKYVVKLPRTNFLKVQVELKDAKCTLCTQQILWIEKKKKQSYGGSSFKQRRNKQSCSFSAHKNIGWKAQVLLQEDESPLDIARRHIFLWKCSRHAITAHPVWKQYVENALFIPNQKGIVRCVYLSLSLSLSHLDLDSATEVHYPRAIHK